VNIAISLVLIVFLASCAAPLRTSVAPFRAPESFPNSKRVWDLVVAADVLDSVEKSSRVFGTDLGAANILPVHLIVSNKGTQEYEIDASQIFGISGGEYYPAFNLSQAAQGIVHRDNDRYASSGWFVGFSGGGSGSWCRNRARGRKHGGRSGCRRSRRWRLWCCGWRGSGSFRSIYPPI
jgi:hypothetical protein